MKFIIDTDPGTDDAVTILIALAHFKDEELMLEQEMLLEF